MDQEKNDWDKFFLSQKKPINFEATVNSIEEFCGFHHSLGSNVALVTSGGTSVPLEHNTVRYIDNFSAGTRGSASAEKFISKDYAVIFLHRKGSLKPFHRYFRECIDFMDITSGLNGEKGIKVSTDVGQKILPKLEAYKQAKISQKILFISYTSLSDYLFLLRELASKLAKLDSKVIIYLAAAVSDFYIPDKNLPEHKIQSSEGPLTVTLEIVPKILAPLVKIWAPEAFTISFKLETDESLLENKSKKALRTYGHSLVIANILQTRKEMVWLVDRESTSKISLNADEMLNGLEIEDKIVNKIVLLHDEFVINKSR
ncbi:Phosphopantothenate--cysteine ligase [Nymphon striatum]|nr:Phosphopantothenate--cysteine ligase [Nymphon striatum]